MIRLHGLLVGAMLAGLLAGCGPKETGEYGKRRPGVDELVDGGRGLQGKDVVAASDQMAQDLLALPELGASTHRWLIVVDRVENRTVNSRFDLNIFLERLRVNLSRYGRGRVQLIENRDKLRDLQSRELEPDPSDPFGQAGGAAAPGPAGIQPDFALYARVMELPTRGTSYYLCEFTLTNLRTREQIWSNAYEVVVNR